MCINSTVFKFGTTFYKKVNGLAMGGSVSSGLANIVMEDLEKDAHANIPFPILHYKRYIDDFFAIVRKEDTHPVLHFFNSRNPSIKFTLEEEVDRKINFLDMTVMRCGNVVKCKWYQKPISSGRYLNFLSVQPDTYKRNVVANLAQRIVRLSDQQFLPETIKIGKKLLVENCYPSPLIERAFKTALKKKDNKESYARTMKKIDFDKLICLPYVPYLSENLAEIFNKYGFHVVHTQYI